MAPRPDDCIAQAFVCRLRVTQLDDDGSVLSGADTSYVSAALAKLTISPQYEDGDEITEKDGCGSVFLDVQAPPTYKRNDVSLDLLSPDPYLSAILVPGSVQLTDGAAVGWGAPPLGVLEGKVSIEAWAKRMDAGKQSQFFPWAWFVLPWVDNLKLGDRELSNTMQHSLITGEALENALWGDGPQNDWPVASDRSWQWIPTDTVPDAHCGPIAALAS